MAWGCSTCLTPARKDAHEPPKPQCKCGAPILQGVSQRLQAVRDALSEYEAPWGWSPVITLAKVQPGQDATVGKALLQIYADRTGCRTFIATFEVDFTNLEWVRILQNQIQEWEQKVDDMVTYANNPALGEAMWRDGEPVQEMGDLYTWGESS